MRRRPGAECSAGCAVDLPLTQLPDNPAALNAGYPAPRRRERRSGVADAGIRGEFLHDRLHVEPPERAKRGFPSAFGAETLNARVLVCRRRGSETGVTHVLRNLR